jgi:hypothetical protein
MATKEKKAVAVVDLRGQFMLPLEDAMQLVNLLSQAALVEYDWSGKTWKYATNGSDGMGNMRLLSAVDVAQIALEQ